MATDSSDPEFVSRVRKAALLKAQIATLEEQVRDVLGELGELDFRKYPAGDYILEVQHNWTMSPSKVQAALKPAQVKQVQKTTIDPTKVKALFPEVYAAAMTPYANPRKFVIKEVTDA